MKKIFKKFFLIFWKEAEVQHEVFILSTVHPSMSSTKGWQSWNIIFHLLSETAIRGKFCWEKFLALVFQDSNTGKYYCFMLMHKDLWPNNKFLKCYYNKHDSCRGTAGGGWWCHYVSTNFHWICFYWLKISTGNINLFICIGLYVLYLLILSNTNWWSSESFIDSSYWRLCLKPLVEDPFL